MADTNTSVADAQTGQQKETRNPFAPQKPQVKIVVPRDQIGGGFGFEDDYERDVAHTYENKEAVEKPKIEISLKGAGTILFNQKKTAQFETVQTSLSQPDLSIKTAVTETSKELLGWATQGLKILEGAGSDTKDATWDLAKQITGIGANTQESKPKAPDNKKDEIIKARFIQSRIMSTDSEVTRARANREMQIALGILDGMDITDQDKKLVKVSLDWDQNYMRNPRMATEVRNTRRLIVIEEERVKTQQNLIDLSGSNKRSGTLATAINAAPEGGRGSMGKGQANMSAAGGGAG